MLVTTTNQFHHWSDHFHTSMFTTINYSSAPVTENHQHEEFPRPNPTAANYQHENFSQPTQAEDDDYIATCPCTPITGDMDISHRKSITIQEHQIYQLTQEVRSLREQQQQWEQQHKQYEQQCKQYEQQRKQMQQNFEQMQQSFEQMCQQYEQVVNLQTRQSNTQHLLIGERYQMHNHPHGIAVIIDNYKFHSTDPDQKPMTNRRGSEVDEKSLYVLWEYLQYDVCILKNCTAYKLFSELQRIALLSHNNYDSFVCCILSHGCSDGVYGADGQLVKIKDIAYLFEGRNCPTLFGKPKMFFIQACRGDNEDVGVFPSDDEIQKDGKDDSNSLPSDADFLFAYSTAPGKASYRSQQHGSWYVSILCEVFYDHASHLDLLNMLIIVNDRVSNACTKDGYKQCPAPVISLRKQVWF